MPHTPASTRRAWEGDRHLHVLFYISKGEKTGGRGDKVNRTTMIVTNSGYLHCDEEAKSRQPVRPTSLLERSSA